ncbi:MAG TPA: FAD-dependent thymidylate synthase [Candidatus Krumholzibacteriaceae bacterium]|nr:FAD-dependent thymidylate synthase [Candidatus Krumholzibacteriaceae bacterium]
MEVKIAGYNIDSILIDDVSGKSDSFTPEVISASYARISRDPRNIKLLRREAREAVKKARASNEKIIFGLGHSSVAEHAVFNFDIMDISRLAVEQLESFRLASFTEKSQRYIKIRKDIIIPAEITACGLEGQFKEVMEYLSDKYDQLYAKMLENGENKYVAREDARYLLPLAVKTQLGMTVNARELEYMISRLASHKLSELNELAEKLCGIAKEIAPSLVRYPEAVDYFSNRFRTKSNIAENRGGFSRNGSEEVKLISDTKDCDNILVAALLFSSADIGVSEARERAAGMSDEEKASIIKSTMENIQPHDSVWREFEHVHLLFEVIVSASCFAQLKRHRMATVTAQPYCRSLGVKIPESVKRAGASEELIKAAEISGRLYDRIKDKMSCAADYVSLNSSRRRVLFDVNLRELYNFSRLRSDRHAQWEIRALSERMCEISRKGLKAGGMLLGGKDDFSDMIDKL